MEGHMFLDGDIIAGNEGEFHCVSSKPYTYEAAHEPWLAKFSGTGHFVRHLSAQKTGIRHLTPHREHNISSNGDTIFLACQSSIFFSYTLPLFIRDGNDCAN